MKKLNLFLLAVLGVTTLHAAKIDQVIVRQQWPWSTDIKVEYRLLEVDAAHPVDLTVKAYNGDVELALPAAAINGDLYGIVDVVGSFTIDPVAAFGTDKIALANFKVKLTLADSGSNINEVLYRVYNLETGGKTDITRKELLNGKYGSIETDYAAFGADFTTPSQLQGQVLVWTAVTNDISYMTTNLVMRKISAKDVVWQMGSPLEEGGAKFADETQTYVKLTEDYFISVFPLTQEQYRLAFANQAPSGFGGFSDSPCRPVEKVTMQTIHGHANPWYEVRGMRTGELLLWPTNSYAHDVSASYCLGFMRTKFGIDFDLPTEAQWEFACRAYSAGALYSGKELSSENVAELAWVQHNSGDETHRVGLKKPNAFGLYDMLGNVWEFTLVSSAAETHEHGATADDPRIDPLGPAWSADYTPGTKPVLRGGCWGGEGWELSNWQAARAATRYNMNDFGNIENRYTGFRVVIPAEGTSWKQ